MNLMNAKISLAGILLLIASSVFAQDATSSLRIDPSPVPASTVAQLASSPAPQQAPAQQVLPGLPAFEGPLASPAPPVPTIDQIDAMFKETSMGKAADEARLHAQWRDLANRIINDVDLIAARAEANAALTDLEKRQRLRHYYTLFFDRMRAKAESPDLKTYLDQRKAEHSRLLDQPRVRPNP
jgi:hypothetical protein